MATEREVLPPRLPSQFEDILERPADGGSLFQFQASEPDWSATLLVKTCMDEGRLVRPLLVSTEFHQAQWCDVQVVKPEGAGLKLIDCHLNRVELDTARLSGACFDEVLFENVEFRNCKLNLAGFVDCQLKLTRFVDCDFSQATFDGCRFDSVWFEGCRFTETDFRASGEKASMRKVDFRYSNLTGIKSVAGLKGATISAAQAVELAGLLAASLGLKVMS